MAEALQILVKSRVGRKGWGRDELVPARKINRDDINTTHVTASQNYENGMQASEYATSVPSPRLGALRRFCFDESDLHCRNGGVQALKSPTLPMLGQSNLKTHAKSSTLSASVHSKDCAKRAQDSRHFVDVPRQHSIYRFMFSFHSLSDHLLPSPIANQALTHKRAMHHDSLDW